MTCLTMGSWPDNGARYGFHMMEWLVTLIMFLPLLCIFVIVASLQSPQLGVIDFHFSSFFLTNGKLLKLQRGDHTEPCQLLSWLAFIFL